MKSKSEIPKDWFLHVGTPSGRRRVTSAIEKRKVSSLDEIAEYVTIQQAADKLKVPNKTVAHWIARKLLKSVKLGSRRYTTAQWVQDFIDSSMEKHG